MNAPTAQPLGRRLVASLVAHLRAFDPNEPSLGSFCGGVPPLDDDALRAQHHAVYAALSAGPDAPLARVARAWHLTPLEIDLLGLSCLPELDDRLASFFLHHTGGRSARPTVGLALRILLGPQPAPEARDLLVRSRLWSEAMLRRGDPDVPLPLVPLHPTAGALAAVEGTLPAALAWGGRLTVRDAAGDPDVALALRHRPGLAAESEALATWLALVGAGVVQIRSTDLGSARTFADALLTRLGRPGLLVEPPAEALDHALREASVVAVALGAIPVVRPEAAEALRCGADWRAVLPTLVLASTSVEVPPGVPCRRVEPPRVRPSEQAGLWAALLGEEAGAVRVDALSNQTRLAPGSIRRVIELARQRAVVEGHAGLAHRHIARALGELADDPQAPGAHVSRPRVGWSSLVLPPGPRARLEDLVRRLQLRRLVEDEWGIGATHAGLRGVVVLLHGDSGTGKTLAASAIATQLSLPLVRVDLARMVSKYIGETEKNLARLFDELEGFRGVLFFDEADSLFGKRTQVQDAHDRYANLETNYLLQRLELFEGVAILSTNLAQNVDEAFSRRFDLILHVPRPGPRERTALWARHLPAERIDPTLELGELGQRYDLVGGEIRNAAVEAAYLAAARGGPIQAEDVHIAVRRELSKKGKALTD